MDFKYDLFSHKKEWLPTFLKEKITIKYILLIKQMYSTKKTLQLTKTTGQKELCNWNAHIITLAIHFVGYKHLGNPFLDIRNQRGKKDNFIYGLSSWNELYLSRKCRGIYKHSKLERQTKCPFPLSMIPSKCKCNWRPFGNIHKNVMDPLLYTAKLIYNTSSEYQNIWILLW